MLDARKSTIQEALKPLEGLPLSGMWRCGIQIFEFGEQKPTFNKKGEAITRADFAIHVDCPWRIIQAEQIIIASWDYLGEEERPKDEYSEAFFELMETQHLTVLSIEANSIGDIAFNLYDGYRLQVLPMGSSKGDEYWRLLTVLPDGTDPHFVVTKSETYLSTKSGHD